MLLPSTVTRSTCPFSTFMSVAALGLISTTLSQVILLCGLGSSCSQPLFE